MAIFKCKSCGGSLEISNNETVATCEYCGIQQTLPKLDNDKKANLYDRANHFRRNTEFDKAMGIYEQILNEDTTDAEAYWSLVLCRYGIEYVEDPATHKRIPTVNRAQYTAVFDDDNYKSALQYADSYQRAVYEEEAKNINEIQKGILAISQKEEPFDVFICYKESDNNGRRTPDSVLANDLYHQLTQEGFKVFFARITLEDKLGSAYEPYIFAALNSAKVMVVLGTKPEYFKAVWVRNEWSRYLALIKQGQQKILIPAYKDMDPYDLPEEFSHLQAQDMTKLGFMQDLIRGIKKITQVDEPQTAVKETVVVNANAGSGIEPLLKRAFMFLEDGDWESADEYCEKVLDIDPECAQAYLGKLMAGQRTRKQEALKGCRDPFDKDTNYQKAIRFGDEKLQKKLAGYIEYINIRNEEERLAGIYNRAKDAMNSADSESSYKKAAEIFATIKEYKDAKALEKECLEKAEAERKAAIEKAEAARKDQILGEAKTKKNWKTIAGYEEAIKLLKSIPGWKDANVLLAEAEKELEELKAKEEADRLERERQAEIERKEAERIAKRKKIIAIISTVVGCIAIAITILVTKVIIPNGKYDDAVTMMEEGNIVEAYEALIALDGYKDSAEKANSIYGKYKCKLANVGDYVFFGAYEQDNNTSNGKEDIEWLVLDVKDGKALVISKYGLDCQPYNREYVDVTWGTCTLRQWLNNDFLNSAFSEEEQGMIPAVTVTADKNPKYDTEPGKDIQDQVFLLSIPEVNKYFGSSVERQCEATAYAKEQGAYVADNGNSWWWLRSRGPTYGSAAYVNDDRVVGDYGYNVLDGSYVVRPALWIDLNP